MEPSGDASDTALVASAFEKLSERDPLGLVALVTEDTVGRFPDVTCHGRGEIAARFEEEFAGIGDCRLDVMAVAADGDDVLVRWRMTGTHSSRMDGLEATGKPVVKDGVTHLVMRGGRAQSLFVIYDRMRIAIDTGLVGPPGSASDRLFKAIFNARVKWLSGNGRSARPHRAPLARPAVVAADPPVGASNLELARWAMDLFGRGDASGILGLVTDATLAEFPEGDLRGREQIAARFFEEVAPFDDFTLTVIASAAVGEHVLLRWHLTGTQNGPFEGIAATGKEVAVDGFEHMRFRGGKLDSVKVILDRMQFAILLGMLAPEGTGQDKVFKGIFNTRVKLTRGLGRATGSLREVR